MALFLFILLALGVADKNWLNTPDKIWSRSPGANNADYIDRHINKSITNYNALGTATFIVAYVNSANFEAFWERYSEHILHYDFPLQIKENFSPLVHPNAATRMASMILTRDGFDFPVYFIALKIS